MKFWEEKILNIKNKYVFSFVGSLSKAFNFQLIKELSILFENNTNVIFVICGEGDESKNVRRLFLNANNVFFPGWVNQNQIYGLMQFTKATIAPYLNDSNFIDNLPNKVLDSLLYGKPVISSLEGEVKNLILNNQVGCFCKNEAKSWFNEIMKLLEDQSYYDFLSRNILQPESRPGTTGISWGVGFKVKSLMINYSNSKYHFAGTSNNITVIKQLKSFSNK